MRGRRPEQRNWPTWWDWELEMTPHVERRMEDRNFSEVELRDMLSVPLSCERTWWMAGSWQPRDSASRIGRSFWSRSAKKR